MHDAFDWWANIWIPVLVGLVTLFTATASLFVAFAALRTARAANNLALDNLAEERLRSRHEVVPLFRDWFHAVRINREDPKDFPARDVFTLSEELDLRLASLRDPYGPVLKRFLSGPRILDHDNGGPHDADAWALKLIDIWATKPQNVAEPEMVRWDFTFGYLVGPRPQLRGRALRRQLEQDRQLRLARYREAGRTVWPEE